MRNLLSKIKDKLISFQKGSILVNSKLGKKVFISKNSFVSNSKINDYSSIGRNSTIVNASIGKYCSISWNVTVGATQHRKDRISTHAFSYVSKFGFVKKDERINLETTVGHDVWVGANAIIMPGISIGSGAIIGAGSIVTKPVPEYAIIVGVPGQIIGFRFPDPAIQKLLDIQWWDMDHSIVKKNIVLWRKPLDNEILKRLEELCA